MEGQRDFGDPEKAGRDKPRQRLWEMLGHNHLQCDSFDYLAMRKKGEKPCPSRAGIQQDTHLTGSPGSDALSSPSPS